VEGSNIKRTKRIIERLPAFYKVWDRRTLLFKIIHSIGKMLDETEKDLDAILLSHWVDTAFREDLDKLGAIFNIKRKLGESDEDFRGRLKRAIVEFKGGGTVSALLTAVKISLGVPMDYPIELIENPPIILYREIDVRTGDTWWFSSNSVLDASPNMLLTVKSEDAKIVKPTLINLETNESITFNGEIKSGDVFEIKNGKAFLNGIDVSEMLSADKMPILLRKGSEWKYAEVLAENIGVFDQARFDDAIFAVGIPVVSLKFEWTAYQPATFEIRIPKDALTGKSVSEVEEIVNSIKAAGVKAIIKVIGG